MTQACHTGDQERPVASPNGSSVVPAPFSADEAVQWQTACALAVAQVRRGITTPVDWEALLGLSPEEVNGPKLTFEEIFRMDALQQCLDANGLNGTKKPAFELNVMVNDVPAHLRAEFCEAIVRTAADPQLLLRSDEAIRVRDCKRGEAEQRAEQKAA